MDKPQALRLKIEEALPEFLRDTHRLKIYVEGGKVASHLGDSFNFEYSYKLSIVVIDFTQSLDLLLLPILRWLKTNQPENMQNRDRAKEIIRFDVDINDNKSLDIMIEIDLTEVVDVTQKPDGAFDMIHRDEPPPFEDEAALTNRPDDERIFVNASGDILTTQNLNPEGASVLIDDLL